MKQAMQLRLSYKLIVPHPFPEDPTSMYEWWAEYELEVLDEDGKLIKNVLEISWDMLDLLCWFIDNKNALLVQEIPSTNLYSSIGETIFNFYEAMDDDFDDDKLLDDVFEYRTTHGIRFALRGTNIPDIYIGVFNKVGTISFCDEKEKWSYEIDLANFLNNVERVYNDIKTPGNQLSGSS